MHTDQGYRQALDLDSILEGRGVWTKSCNRFGGLGTLLVLLGSIGSGGANIGGEPGCCGPTSPTMSERISSV